MDGAGLGFTLVGVGTAREYVQAFRLLPCPGYPYPCRGWRGALPPSPATFLGCCQHSFFLVLTLLFNYNVLVTSNKRNTCLMLSNTSPYTSFPFMSKMIFL